MARIPTILCLGNSNTAGLAPISGVPFATDFIRWVGLTAPPGTEPYSASSTGWKFWQNRLPYKSGDVRSTASSTNTSVTFDGSPITAAQINSWLWVRTDGGAGHGQHRRITAGTGTNTATVATWTTNPSATGTIELLTGSHTVNSATTTTLTKVAATTPDFTSADVGRWVVMIGGALAGQARKITAASANTITLDNALGGTPASGDGFRILDGDGASEDIDSISGSFRDFQIVYSDALSFSDGYEFPGFINGPRATPIAYTNDADRYVNYVPELAWQFRAYLEAPVHVIALGVSGSTLATQFVGTTFQAASYGWAHDVAHLDWNPSSPDNLLQAFKAMVTAAAESLDEGDQLDVLGVFGTLLENDTSLPAWLVKAGQNIENLRDHLREWLIDNDYTTRERLRIPFVLSNLRESAFGVPGEVANGLLAQVVAADPYTEEVDTADLTYVDSSHFDAPGQIALARSFFTAWYTIVQGEDAAQESPNVFGPSDALWSATKSRYPTADLLSLSNIRNSAATTIDDEAGTAAAQAVIDLWPMYAQVDYDADNRQHVEVAVRAVVAMLWSRGGTATATAKIEWDEVFSDAGLIAKVKMTGPRGRPIPMTNSGVVPSDESRGGRAARPWSDPAAIPRGQMPRRRLVDGVADSFEE